MLLVTMVKSMQMVFCACGCGQLRPMFDNKGRRKYYILGHHGINTRFKRGCTSWCKGKYFVNPDLTMSDDLAYILGVYVSDGYLTFSTGSWLMGLHVTEKIFAESFRGAMLRIGLHPSRICETNETPRGKMTTYYRTVARSNKLHDFIETLDMSSLYNMLTEKESFGLQFLRGCFESEGSARNRKGHGVEIVLFSNTNTNLVDLVSNLLEWLGRPFSVTKEERGEKGHKTLYRIYIHGDSKTKKKFLCLLNPVIKMVM